MTRWGKWAFPNCLLSGCCLPANSYIRCPLFDSVLIVSLQLWSWWRSGWPVCGTTASWGRQSPDWSTSHGPAPSTRSTSTRWATYDGVRRRRMRICRRITGTPWWNCLWFSLDIRNTASQHPHFSTCLLLGYKNWKQLTNHQKYSFSSAHAQGFSLRNMKNAAEIYKIKYLFKYAWIYMWIKLNQVNVSEYPKSQFSDLLI